MSDFISPKYSKRQLNLQMVNCYVGIHDLHCHCKKPLNHIIQQIYQQEPTLTKWQGTTSDATGDHDGEKDIDGFGPGELERLFAEDDADKDG